MAFGPEIGIRNDLRPGDIGYLVRWHGVLYAQECGWDYTFEAYVAGPLAEFALSHNDRERIWLMEKDGVVVGSIAVVEAGEDEAQLRWLLVHPDLRGQGMGRFLMEEALGFCRERTYRRAFLWTVSSLRAAGNLYQSLGFVVTEEKTHRLWGAWLTEQRYELGLKVTGKEG